MFLQSKVFAPASLREDTKKTFKRLHSVATATAIAAHSTTACSCFPAKTQQKVCCVTHVGSQLQKTFGTQKTTAITRLRQKAFGGHKMTHMAALNSNEILKNDSTFLTNASDDASRATRAIADGRTTPAVGIKNQQNSASLRQWA